MKKMLHSMGFALSGLSLALKEERNIKLFCLGECIVVISLLVRGLRADLWLWIVSTGALFVMIELLNTALEHLADTVHECEQCNHGTKYHIGIKHAKDTAAAASLVALSLHGSVILWIAFNIFQ